MKNCLHQARMRGNYYLNLAINKYTLPFGVINMMVEPLHIRSHCNRMAVLLCHLHSSSLVRSIELVLMRVGRFAVRLGDAARDWSLEMSLSSVVDTLVRF